MIRRMHALLPPLCGILLASAASAGGGEAAGLLQESLERYASLRAYRDRGSVTTYKPAAGPFVSVLDRDDFRTHFHRGAGFRFEWESHHPFPLLRNVVTRNAVWSGPEGVHSFFVGKLRREESLSLALGGFVGVTSGVTAGIPRLLMGDARGSSLARLRHVVRLEDAELGGTPCYRVKGRHPAGDLFYEAWLGKQDLLVRRVLETGGVWTDDEIHWDIEVDGAVPAPLLDPPPPRLRLPGPFFWIGLLAAGLGLWGLATRRALVLRTRWTSPALVLAFLSGAFVNLFWLYDPTTGRIDVEALSCLALPLFLVPLAYAIAPESYSFLGLRSDMLRQGLLATLGRLELDFEERGPAIHLPAVGAELRLQASATGPSLRVRPRYQAVVLRQIVAELPREAAARGPYALVLAWGAGVLVLSLLLMG